MFFQIRESLCAVRSSKALNFQLKDDENRSENLDLEDVESDLSWMVYIENILQNMTVCKQIISMFLYLLFHL